MYGFLVIIQVYLYHVLHDTQVSFYFYLDALFVFFFFFLDYLFSVLVQDSLLEFLSSSILLSMTAISHNCCFVSELFLFIKIDMYGRGIHLRFFFFSRQDKRAEKAVSDTAKRLDESCQIITDCDELY